jgi:hypothetical protein
MPPQGIARSDYFKQLYIIFAALLMGMVIFAFVAWSQSGRMGGGGENLSGIFRIIVPVLALSGLIAGQVVFRWKMNSIGPAADLNRKLAAYREALIIKLALVEGPALFASISFMMTGNTVFLAMVGVLILFFLYNKPNKSRLIMDLKLTAEEARVVEEEM